MIGVRLFVAVMIGILLAITQPVFGQFTGIYVEFHTASDLCPGNPSFGDGWAPVSGFPNRGGGCTGATSQPGLAYGSNVTFSGNAGTTYRVWAVDNTQPIGNITVSGSSITLLVGASTDPFTNPNAPLTIAGGGAIGNVNASGGTVQIRSTASVASVSAATVVRIDARNSIGGVNASGAIGTVRAPRLTGLVIGTSIDVVEVVNWNGGVSEMDFSAGVQATNGNIGRVTVTNARLLGSVMADLGSIATRINSGIGIGPATGSPMTIRAKNGIARVDAPSINANIDAKFNSGSGQLQTLTTTATGNFSGSLSAAAIGSTGTGVSIAGNLLAPVTVSGDVLKPFTVAGSTSANVSLLGTISQPVIFTAGYSSGTFSLGNVTSNVTFGGTLGVSGTIASTSSASTVAVALDIPATKTLQITGNHMGTCTVGGSIAGSFNVGGSLTGTLIINGSLSMGGSITTGSSGNPGLPGQVIINAGNASGQWLGSVKVGGSTGTVLTMQPHYDNASLSLGGGAVGENRFNLHRKDSFPAELVAGQPIMVSGTGVPSESNPIEKRHYGPVTWDSLGDPPYTVWRRAAEDATEVDITSCFVQERDPNNHTIVTLKPNDPNNSMIVGERLLRGFHYRIEPKEIDEGKEGSGENVLRCELPSGANPPVLDYASMEYFVCITNEDQDGDANDNGCVNFADVTSVLTNFGLTSCHIQGDADRDGDVDFADVTEVLTFFGLVEYCPNCTGGSSFAAGNHDGFTTMGLDADMTSSEAVTAMQDALTTMGYASIVAFVDAIGAMEEEARNAEIRRLGDLLEDSQ